MRYFLKLVARAGLLLSLAVPCLAAENAILRNGFSIRHERRQIVGDVTRLFVDGGNSSFVDIPTAEIDHFEPVPEEHTAQAKPEQATPTAADASIKRPVDLNELINSASDTYKLDPDLVNSVIRAESGFNVHAVSPKGAQGLMQLMPQTASELGVQNAFDPQANVDGGARYLRELLEKYDFDLIKALAAYNAGPQRVEQYGGVPPYYETKAYVARIVRDFNKKKLAQKTAATPTAKTTPGSIVGKQTAKSKTPAHKPHDSGTQEASNANPR
ncbi:MAG TPA: lytic transglycosylase domain-containing protein [Candidatus Binatia bacterium]|nr:lytic transglycosylase domain-containing protein [Candidatus Binatia bacterium]